MLSILSSFWVNSQSSDWFIHCTWDSLSMFLCSSQPLNLELGVWVHRIRTCGHRICDYTGLLFSSDLSVLLLSLSLPSLSPLPHHLFSHPNIPGEITRKQSTLCVPCEPGVHTHKGIWQMLQGQFRESARAVWALKS